MRRGPLEETAKHPEKYPPNHPYFLVRRYGSIYWCQNSSVR